LKNNEATNVIGGGVDFNVFAVTSARDAANALDMTLGSPSGTSITIGGNAAIDAAHGSWGLQSRSQGLGQRPGNPQV
jgi:hypothetical protein